jgi:hypothetical protein
VKSISVCRASTPKRRAGPAGSIQQMAIYIGTYIKGLVNPPGLADPGYGPILLVNSGKQTAKRRTH